eukprot:Stramenopile-MAST_4_protein_3859
MHTVAQKDTLSPLEVVVDGLANIHTTLDADQDGTLSMADTAIHMETASKALDADADGALSYTDLRDTITTALDANDDQHLTVQDVAHHAHQAADLNGDGVCSFCGGCDDYCGPNNGCPCEACLEYYRNHVKNPPASASAHRSTARLLFVDDFQGDY